jgi:aminopeptidase N
MATSENTVAEMTYSYDVDLYTPDSGNFGVAVSNYDLEIDYRMSSNRLQATATLTVLAQDTLKKFSLDLYGLTVTKVTLDGVRVPRFTQTKTKLKIDAPTELIAGQE